MCSRAAAVSQKPVRQMTQLYLVIHMVSPFNFKVSSLKFSGFNLTQIKVKTFLTRVNCLSTSDKVYKMSHLKTLLTLKALIS